MRISLHRVDDAFHFVASNEAGNEVHIDVPEDEGGTGQGAGPMQMLIMGLGGCSSIDVISILKKQRQPIDGYDVAIDYARADATPAVFTTIHLHFMLTGDLDPAKVRRAIALSLEKYCSASRIIGQTATITASFAVNGTRYEVSGSGEQVSQSGERRAT